MLLFFVGVDVRIVDGYFVLGIGKFYVGKFIMIKIMVGNFGNFGMLIYYFNYELGWICFEVGVWGI